MREMASHSQLNISHVRVYQVGGMPNSPGYVRGFKCNHVWANLHMLTFVISIDCQSSALFSNSQLLTGETGNALLPTCILIYVPHAPVLVLL